MKELTIAIKIDEKRDENAVLAKIKEYLNEEFQGDAFIRKVWFPTPRR